MTTSSGASACTPNGFSALVSPPPLSVSPPPPLEQQPPRVLVRGTHDLSPLRDRGTQAVRRMRPAYRASKVLLCSYPPGTLADTYTGGASPAWSSRRTTSATTSWASSAAVMDDTAQAVPPPGRGSTASP